MPPSAWFLVPLFWLLRGFWALKDAWNDNPQGKSGSLNKREFANVALHAVMNGGAVALIAILQYVLQWLPATGPWGMIIAAAITTVLTLLRKFTTS